MMINNPLDILQRPLLLFEKKEKYRIYLLILAIVFGACLDSVGIASIMPFMAIVTDDYFLERYEFLGRIYQYGGFTSIDSFKVFFGIIVFFLLIISIAYSALITGLQVSFIHNSTRVLSQRLFNRYISQKYEWYLIKNSSTLANSILNEVDSVVAGVIMPMLSLISSIAATLIVGTTLAIINFKATLIISIVCFTSYLIVYRFSRSKLLQIGIIKVNSTLLRMKILSEAFGGIKDVKVTFLERHYTKNFNEASKLLAKSLIQGQIYAQFPKFLLESIAFGGMIIMVIITLNRQDNSAREILPILTLFAFAAYKLMPKIQNIYSDITKIRIGEHVVDRFQKEVDDTSIILKNDDSTIINFDKSIKIHGISYVYPKKQALAVSNISFEIKKGDTIGIVGKSGSGKTTLIDVILGLLKPTSGSIELDKIIITEERIRAWQSLIAYVPQNIFITDNSVASNIAYGQYEEGVDYERLHFAAKIAELDHFIAHDLPGGYEAILGERGLRLSGGQKQRIGIARAIYRMSPILILDEATSSLDSITEAAVMENIRLNCGNVTTIIVAHRLSTIKQCDKIFVMKKGNIHSSGDYEELSSKCEYFGSFIKATAKNLQ